MRTIPAILVVASLVAAGLVAFPVLGQKKDIWGIHGLRVPEPTNDGVWDGTWWYVNRDSKVAMWIRTVDGTPEVKFQYANRMASEMFTTDWNAQADYSTYNGTGSFAMTFTERTADSIKAGWDWVLVVGKTNRKQRGKIRVFRTGTGRQMVMHFTEFEFAIGPIDTAPWQAAEQAWTFRKASKRLVRWEELPF
jgi:hypothetical protein